MELTAFYDFWVEDYIRSEGWIKPGAKIYDYEIAGEGNMNFVARVCTSHGNIIVKKSRAYVNKYPQIAAPIERIEIEKKYYEIISCDDFLKSFSPRIIGYDWKFHTLAMEDLGYGSDFISLYKNPSEISENELLKLVEYLLHLHKIEALDFPENAEMKKLNHEHIFNYPFLIDNGFDLDSIQSGLQSLAMEFKKDEVLKAEINKIGIRYLSNGSTLLHGDFYPGSWLKVNEKIKVIDPEFAFIGDREFDLSVMLAHLHLANVSPKLIALAQKLYTDNITLDQRLLNQYIGIEIMRRIIGLAQLPLGLNTIEKGEKMMFAKSLIMNNIQ